MHHVVLERWSRRASGLHARDARVKLAATLVVLLLIGTTVPSHPLAFAAEFVLLMAALLVSRLPIAGALMRAGAVLPFSAIFALVSWLAGDPAKAAALVIRGYMSALAVLLLVSTTPLPDLLRALSWFHVPRLIILITQFLYRYLFVLSEQAQHMRLAAASRAGGRRAGSGLASRFRAAAGALSVLFARSYARADGIHRAMIARGFSGEFPASALNPVRLMDFLFLGLTISAAVLIRTAA